MNETLFTNEEFSNLLALLEAGARGIAGQTVSISKAAEILIVANTLMEKLKQLNGAGRKDVN